MYKLKNNSPLFIDEPNLSHAWGKAFLHIIDNTGSEITPLLVTVTNFDNGAVREDANIVGELNKALTNYNEQEIHTVANTIFPQNLWQYSNFNRKKLFDVYIKSLPRFKALARHKNWRGLYFERLINYGEGSLEGNQLEFIINQYNSRSGVRRSMFQASIFDPKRDHVKTAQLGFPCLQHVSFVPSKKGITINAFYATQQIFQKAYGNFLGLCRLGNFMAHEMKLELERMNCFVGVEKLDNIDGKKSERLKDLISTIRNSITDVC